MRAAASIAVGVATVLLLTGCFGPGKDVLIQQASDDFDSLVSTAASVDVTVLHTLEVEDPTSELCSTESNDEHTVFIAAGTMAIGTTGVEERAVLAEFGPTFADEERWTAITDGLDARQVAYIDVDGITASAKIEDGLLVIAVFTPCRG
ncbi:MAG: hypothetical protein KF761_02450 [Salinibacterium sp.]|nr:hypothetical protein [Salinibacterium sp.]